MKRFFCRLIGTLAVCATANPALAADYFGLYPGMDERFLMSAGFIGSGGVYSHGVVNNTYVEVLCINHRAATVEVIYAPGSADRSMPPELQRQITLSDAVRIHSGRAGNVPPVFGYILTRPPEEIEAQNAINRSRGWPLIAVLPQSVIGIGDIVNRISYVTTGMVSGSSQCLNVCYCGPDAPWIEKARYNPIRQNLLSELGGMQNNATERMDAPSDDSAQQTASSFGSQNGPERINGPMPKTMEQCLSFRLFDKTLKTESLRDHIDLTINFKNLSPKDIRAFKGTVGFVDILGDCIYQATLKVEDVLASGESRSEVFSVEYNPLIAKDRTLAAAEKENIQLKWSPEILLFTDGTSARKVKVGDDEGSER